MSEDLKQRMGRFNPDELFAHSRTSIDEVAKGIIRFSTTVDPNYVPGGFVYNQYLVLDEKPLLYHTGKRTMFPVFKRAFEQVLPFDRLRYISFAHGEPDECGALNSILDLSPNCVPIVNKICNMVIVSDSVARPAQIVADGELIDLGTHKLRWIDTPHFPHNWESAMMFEETTRTLFCGDLFTHLGNDLPAVTEKDLVELSEPVRRKLDYISNPRGARPHIERLANHQPEVMACMHGSAWRGDGARLLNRYADALES